MTKFEPVDNLYNTTEDTLIAAHQAGMAYWNRNKAYNATRDGLESLARSLGWHGEENQSFLAGFYGAKRRDVDHAHLRVACGIDRFPAR